MADPADDSETHESGESEARAGSREGLNTGEDAMAWAIAHFGADSDLTEHLRSESGQGILARLAELPEDDSERLLELEAWRERTRRSDRVESRFDLLSGAAWADAPDRWIRRVQGLLARGPEAGVGASVRAQLAVVNAMIGDAAELEWPAEEQPTGPLGIRQLVQMDENSSTDTLVAIGVWQIAGIVAGEGRRRAARAGSKIPAEWSDVFQAALGANSELAIEAATRIQEVYLGLRRRGFVFEEIAERLGLFSVISAAGGRFERRLQVWLSQAPAGTTEAARQLQALNPRGLRIRIGPAFRSSLRAFWTYWEGRVGEDGVDHE